MASCSRAPAPTAQPAVELTFTPRIEITPTVLPTATAQASATPTHSVSATPTEPPLTLSTITFDSIPAWLSDPKIPVLMQWLRRDASASGRLAFLNPATGEWADLRYPADAGYYFWFDSTHFGFLSTDLTTMALIDLVTGIKMLQTVPKDSTHWIEANESEPKALQVKRKLSSRDKYIFDHIDQPNSRVLSRSWRYTAQVDWDLGGNPVKIVDNETGDILWESDLKDGLWESEFAWSPHINGIIAFVRGSPDGESSSLVTRNTILKLINVNTEQVLAEYQADIGNIKWSSDGSRILYESVLSRYASMGVRFTGAPCIFDTLSFENRCLLKIAQAPVPAGYQLDTTGLYTWSPDGQSIRYMALYSSTANPSQRLGRVCIYTLLSGTITCPTDSLQEPNGWGISYYDFSPEGQFINYCYSESTILDGHVGDGYDALIRADGTGLLTWMNVAAEGKSRCSYFNQVWRPLPQDD